MMQATVVYTILQDRRHPHRGVYFARERALLAIERCKADVTKHDPDDYADYVWIDEMTAESPPQLRAVYLLSPQELNDCDAVAARNTPAWFREAGYRCSGSFTIVECPPDVYGAFS